MSEARDQRLPGLRCCIQLAASSGYEVDEGRGDSVYRFRDDIIKCPYIYDIVLKAIKLISTHPDYDNLFITYLCLYQGQNSFLNNH